MNIVDAGTEGCSLLSESTRHAYEKKNLIIPAKAERGTLYYWREHSKSRE